MAPHQCVHCGKIIPIGSKELLDGCTDCKRRFFFYIKEEQLQKAREQPLIEIPAEEKKQVEKDVREMAGVLEEDTPVILDFESVRISGEGKFELDLIKLFRKDLPLVYKLEEGKYIIDLASTLRGSVKGMKQIVKPKLPDEIMNDDKNINYKNLNEDDSEDDDLDDEENEEEDIDNSAESDSNHENEGKE
jgi:hypothetical protein